MKGISGWKIQNHVKRTGIFLIMVALIAGMGGCADLSFFEIDPGSGEMLETVVLTSRDEVLAITIPEGTIALDKDGNPLLRLEVNNDPEQPAPPEDAHVIGLAYGLGPSGATFDPAMTLTWRFNPMDIPEGVDEEDLVIAYYDEARSQWLILESEVDTLTNVVEASVAHLTTFAALAIPPVQYNLFVSSTAGGDVTTPGEGAFTYDERALISLVAKPDEGYQFVNWTGDVATIANVNDPSTTITMNGDYSMAANFVEIPPIQYSLSISSASGGLVTTPGEGTFTYDAGTVVNLVASSAVGYYFINWTGDVSTVANVNAASTAMTMNGDCSITANFAEIPVTYYALTMAITDGGSTSPAVGQHTYSAGTVVPIVATPDIGYQFVNWIGNVGTIANVNDPSTTITMNGEYFITATFAPIGYTITASAGSGGSISPVGAVAVSHGGSRTFTITPNTGYEVGNVVVDGILVGPVSSYTFEDVTSDHTIHATFDLIEYTITITSTGGGSVTVPGEGTFIYNAGTVAGLEAAADEGYQFVKWVGGPIDGVATPVTSITMDDDYSVMASFAEEGVVIFPDFNLETAIREAIGKPTDPIYPPDLEALDVLVAGGRHISDLTGMEYCTNLIELDVNYNQISDIAPLANLASLTHLYLYHNQISDISLLANLPNLTHLYLYSNPISDFSPLANLAGLRQLSLAYTDISDISLLANLIDLRKLYLYDNQISDVSPLANLTSLTELCLERNQISDVSPLIQNEGLGAGDKVYLYSNPLSSDSINIYIPQLQARGVTVYY